MAGRSRSLCLADGLGCPARPGRLVGVASPPLGPVPPRRARRSSGLVGAARRPARAPPPPRLEVDPRARSSTLPLLGAAALLGAALADREPVGEQDLVGGRAQVAAEVPAGRVARGSRGSGPRSPAAVSAAVGRAVGGRGGLAAPELALECRAPDRRRLDLAALLGLGAQRRDPHRQTEVGGAPALEQESQRQQVVVQRLERGRCARGRPRSARSRVKRRRRPGPAWPAREGARR